MVVKMGPTVGDATSFHSPRIKSNDGFRLIFFSFLATTPVVEFLPGSPPDELMTRNALCEVGWTLVSPWWGDSPREFVRYL